MFDVSWQWVQKDDSVISVSKGGVPLYCQEHVVHIALDPLIGILKSERNADEAE